MQACKFTLYIQSCQTIQLMTDKKLRIILANQQEIHSQFLQLFTKYVINSSQSTFQDHFQKKKYLTYSQVYNYLKAFKLQEGLKKAPLLKNSPFKYKANSTFSFQAYNNSVIMLLDLSPYMLLYDYSTQSTPLLNLQKIVKDLMIKLKQKKEKLLNLKKQCDAQSKTKDNQTQSIQLNLTVYMFSIYEQYPKLILYRQEFNTSTFALLTQYVIKTINETNYPYQVKEYKTTIGSIIQKILDQEEPILGIQSMMVLSSFNQKQESTKIFFTCNWYTYGFINVGSHIGSYIVQQRQIYDRYGSSPFFQMKYVFSCNFIQNWQKVDKMKSSQYSFLPTKTQRHKIILYLSNDRPYQNIFDQLLQFKINIQNKKSSKSVYEFFGQKNPNKINDLSTIRQYKIPQQNFNYILRTRYQQGWQPISQDTIKPFQYSKVMFKFQMTPFVTFIYKAERQKQNFGNKRNFLIQIQVRNINEHLAIKKNKTKFQINDNKKKLQLLQLIQKIDVINSSKFDVIHTELLNQLDSKKKNMLSSFNKVESETSALRYIVKFTHQWGKFAKIKYLYFKFTPYLSKNLLQQFLSEISFFLGTKVYNTTIYVKKSQRLTQNSQQKAILSKLSRKFNVLKIQLGFLKYSYKEIKQLIQPFTMKFQTKKFKSGQVSIVSQQLYKFNQIQNVKQSRLFKNKWKIKLANSMTFKIFLFYFNNLMKKLSFIQIGEQRSLISQKKYVRAVSIIQSSESSNNNDQSSRVGTRKSKSVFCNLQCNLQTNQIQVHFYMFPLIIKLLPCQDKNCKIHRSMNYQQSQSCSKDKKQITLFDFFSRFTESIKYKQFTILNLMATYQTIHYKLLKKVLERRNSKRFCVSVGSQLKEAIKEMYNFRGINFDNQYQMLCQTILATYYSKIKQKESQQANVNIDMIPIPERFLIEADIDSLKGDLVLQNLGVQYTFFLFSPYMPIYVCRNGNQFFYKAIHLMYQDINIRQNQEATCELMIKQIKKIIEKEEYRKNYSSFFYKGTLDEQSKNLSNFKTTKKCCQQINVRSSQYLSSETEVFLKKIKKFQSPIEFYLDITNICSVLANKQNQQDNIISQRVKILFKEFSEIYYDILKIFFQRQRNQFHLQVAPTLKEMRESRFFKYGLSRQKLNQFNEICLKNYLKISNDECISLCRQNFSELIFTYKNQILSGKVKIMFVCYSQIQEDSSKNTFLEYFFKTMAHLCQQFYIELCRVVISKEIQLVGLRKNPALKHLKGSSQIKFTNLIVQTSPQKISKYIQSQLMYKIMPFKKIPNQIYQYVIFKETKQNQSSFIIPSWIIVELSQNKIEAQFCEYTFFIKDHIIQTQINSYINQLFNLINVDSLVKQLSDTYLLPLEPHQLYISQVVNSKQNKLLQAKKKPKAPVPKKGIRAKLQKQKVQHSKKVDEEVMSNAKKFSVPLLYKNNIPLNDRLRPGEGLQAIKKYQSFHVASISNLKNTYLFPLFMTKENIIFHFQETEADKLPKDYAMCQSYESETSSINFKSKRVLIYYAHSLNTFLNRNQVEKVIRLHIKEALNQKIFECLSFQLYKSPQIIQEAEQKDLKAGQKKTISFDIPFIPFRDDFRGYLKQHILMYHTKTQFKSQKNKEIKSKKSIQQLPEKLQKLQRSNSSLSNDNRFQSKQFQISTLSHAHSQQYQLTNNNNKNSSFISNFSAFSQDKKMGESFIKRNNSINVLNQLLEDKRCIDHIWLFNSQKNKKLQSKFGRCLYLMKIDIIHNVDTVQFVNIWQKGLIYGKKQSKHISHPISAKLKTQIKDYLTQKKALSKNNIQTLKNLKTTVTFQILHYLGNPIFTAVEQVFNSILRASLSDYYIQNCLNLYRIQQFFPKILLLKEKLKQQKYPEFELQSPQFLKHSKSTIRQIPLQSQKSTSKTFIDSNQNQSLMQNTESLKFYQDISIEQLLKKIYDSMLSYSICIDKVIQLSANQSLFKVICNQDVLIKDISIYFKDFVNQTKKIFKCNNQKKCFLLYGELFNNKRIFWTSDTIPKQNQGLQFKKLGIIFTDDFIQYFDLLNDFQNQKNLEKNLQKINKDEKKQNSKQKLFQVQWLQRFKIFLQDKSFCLSDYYFTRNIYLHYEITYEGFKYFSYNANINFNNQIYEYLQAIQNWLQQKFRLLKFIKNIKENQIYQVSSLKKKSQNKFGFIYQLYVDALVQNKSLQDSKRIKEDEASSLNLTKLLLSLTFDQFPFKHADSTFMAINRQINQVFQMLKLKQIPYKKYPQYKGKQKFILQKLGRQYISLLRQQYGVSCSRKMSSATSIRNNSQNEVK